MSTITTMNTLGTRLWSISVKYGGNTRICCRKVFQNLTRKQDKNVFLKGKVFSRSLLSSSYNEDIAIQSLQKTSMDLTSVCLHMDRCHERNFEYNSLSLDRMVKVIREPSDLEVALYYFYKYRHNENNYFLRPWTVHTWMQKCVNLDRKDLILRVLQDKIQYGLFPDSISYNQILNGFIVDKNFNDAFKIVEEMFMAEMWELPSSCKLALYTVYHYYLGNKKEENSNILETFKNNTETLRNIGGVLYRVGELQKEATIKLMGMTILSYIEKENGIESVHQKPWAPLMWKEDIHEELINYLESTETPITNEAIEMLMNVAKDHGFEDRFISAKESLKNKNLLSDSSFESIVQEAIKDLAKYEAEDLKLKKKWVEKWEAELKSLEESENKILLQQKKERDEYFAEKRIKDSSHKLAVEFLGYWDLSKFDEDGKEININEEDLPPYFKSNYVDGSLSDIVIENFMYEQNLK